MFDHRVKQKVIESFHNDTADRCVDIFIRHDHTIGYEEYRRDFEDGGGWRSLNRYSSQVFESQAQALKQARLTVAWLNELE